MSIFEVDYKIIVDAENEEVALWDTDSIEEAIMNEMMMNDGIKEYKINVRKM